MTLPSRPSIWSALAGTALGLSVLTAASSVWAGAPTDALRDFFGGVNIVLTDPATEQEPFERLRLIRRHVNDAFDFREAAKLALGREWAARTRIEQNEFVAMFADLLERSFVWRVAGKASLGGGVMRYLDERVTGDVATVDTELAGRDGNEIRLQYRLVHRSARWVVCDVVMDGVSTMQNYHAQFQRIVRESSYTQSGVAAPHEAGAVRGRRAGDAHPHRRRCAAPGRDAVRVPGNHRTDRSRASGDRTGRRRGRHSRLGRERRRAVRTGESTWRGAHAGEPPRIRRPAIRGAGALLRSGRRRLRLRLGPCPSPPTHRRSRCNRRQPHRRPLRRQRRRR